MKNPFGKAVKAEQAYFVLESGEWTWQVLKFYKHPIASKGDPYARVFCNVVTPTCPRGEMGDVYVRDIPGLLSAIGRWEFETAKVPA